MECGRNPIGTPYQADTKRFSEETASTIKERTSFAVGEEATLTKIITDEEVKTVAHSCS